MEDVKEIQLQSGYYFSPGFYLDYWGKSIIGSFTPEVVVSHNKLQKHREVWLGAHLAAMKTKLSEEKYFVALPETEPPDVLIGGFVKAETPQGRIGKNLDPYPVEITRCNMAEDEVLVEQIKNKNSESYSNQILVVYLQGTDTVPSLESLSEKINDLKQVYPREIIIIVELAGAENNLPDGCFGFAQVYPDYEVTIVNRDNQNIFFKSPDIMQITGRGVQTDSVHLGSVKLMRPEI